MSTLVDSKVLSKLTNNLHNCFCFGVLPTFFVLAGHELNEEEKYELVTAATYMHIKREELGRQFLNQDRYV